MSVLDKLKELDKQRQKLLVDAKAEALKRAEQAVKELNELGFNYALTEAGKSTSKRRTGIRDDVLAVVAKHPNGITRADLLDVMDAKGDTSAEQSVSNALSALKKQGKLSANDGVYRTS